MIFLEYICTNLQCLQLFADLKFNRLSIGKASKKSPQNDHATCKVLEGAAAMVECLVWRRGIEFSKPNFLRFAGAMAKSKGIYHWNNGNFLSCGRTFWNLYFRTPESTEMVWQDPLSRQRMQQYFHALGIKILFHTFTINHARSGTWMKLGWRLAIYKPSKVLIKKGSKAINGKMSISLEK